MSLRELAFLFLRLGLTAFGGPAAHTAMMEEEFVRRRKLLTHPEFLELVAACNLIPGPNSTELAIHLGHRFGGRWGLFLAGTCFILPAFLLVLGCAWAYVEYRSLPQVGGLLYGIQPIIVAIIISALVPLVRSTLTDRPRQILACTCFGVVLLGVSELLLLVAAGVIVWLVRRPPAPSTTPTLVPMTLAVPGPFAMQMLDPLGLFLTFVKIGSLLFGSGYVLPAFLRSEFVIDRAILTEAQLLDAVAVGQMTPGPVFTMATFIGFLLADWQGAIAATVGIFLPAFVFVAWSIPILPKLRASLTAHAFLDGVIVASLALMATVAWQLGRSAITDGLTLGLAILAGAALGCCRINSTWLIAYGGAVGLLAK